MNEMKYILAATYRDADNYAEAQGFKNWIFIDRPSRLRGLFEPKVIVVGEYTKNPRILEIEVAMARCGAERVAAS